MMKEWKRERMSHAHAAIGGPSTTMTGMPLTRVKEKPASDVRENQHQAILGIGVKDVPEDSSKQNPLAAYQRRKPCPD